MDIKPIRTKADYRATLMEIETLMDSEAGEKLKRTRGADETVMLI